MKKLCSWMMHSILPEMTKFCGTLKSHWNKIFNYFDNKYTNATLEGINSIIQNIKRRARCFRNKEYFKTMIYLVCRNLDYDVVINAYSEIKKQPNRSLFYRVKKNGVKHKIYKIFTLNAKRHFL